MTSIDNDVTSGSFAFFHSHKAKKERSFVADQKSFA
jgi:hypothetical protein